MVFLLLLTSLLPIDWILNDHPEAGFSIEAPMPLKHDSTIIKTDVGPIDYHSYHGTLEEDQATYVFLVQYYQSETLTYYRDSVELREEFFAATIEQSALSIAGQVMIKDDVKLKNEYPGKFWRTHYNAGASVMKTQAYLVNDHFYLLQVAVDSKHSLSDYIDHFFETFRLQPTKGVD